MCRPTGWSPCWWRRIDRILSAPTARNAVRIIGGEWRRRLLRFPDALALRPTPDRVRETLFNWLGQSMDGLHCLDLFAGSGALGVEAASRGAARVVLVENAAPVVAALQENLRQLVPDDAHRRVELVRSDALQFAARCVANGQRFDVIFVDPPYRQGWWPKLQPQLDALSSEGGRVYAEAEMPLDAWEGWTLIRHGKAGQVFHHLFEKDAAHVE